MSASPASAVPGRTPNGAGPPPPPRRRPPPKTNPLNARHKPSKQIQRPRPAIAPPSNREQSIPLGMPPKTFAAAPPSPTESRPPTYVIPIKSTKRELLQGLRYHVARLITKENIDIADEKQFDRPVRLHRKDPRFHPSSNTMEVDSKEELIDEKQREQLEAAKLEKQRIREEQAKQMAPAASQKRKPQAFKKKVEQVYRADDTPEERKRQQLRYEEALPWHIEDFEEKKVWQGSYEAALSECHVMLMQQPDNSFRLVPLEKWYRFREKATQKQRLDPEQAEQQMTKGQRAPRWLLKNEAQERRIKAEEAAYQKASLFTRSGEKEPKRTANGMDLDQPEVDPDANDIDYNVEEDFADDEENDLFEGDDDTKKMAEEKLKRDQLNANVFDMKNEKEVDAEEEQEKLLAEVAKRLEKGTRKALLRREKNLDYASDSEENPYSSESESEDSELERQKEEERKKEEESKAKLDQKNAKSTKPPSGASSRGANTPSGRKEKHVDTLRVKAIKRPGSPNLSEASGNESSRKRAKIKQGTSTPRPAPEAVRRDGGASRPGGLLGTAGSGSDTDARTANPRIKLTLSQRGSRAASPTASGQVSRAGSPSARSPAGSSTPAPGAAQAGFPTAAEIARHVPKEGITIQGLLNVFKGRFDKKERFKDFVAEVKKVTKLHPTTKGLLVPKVAPAS
ncbi:uncharacterized protein PV09_01247 [Verruconis gallopava]|uniref:Uncharacterized protein n=1 Tax=Verruconis gallopava TaxID=253628 RepID=A0A0D2AP53_9PEZI|nr:uncharacterized protein PV09_01247 [Verruconis gallopava]KIW08330.1 hypothetical protein PV09_01247 [Verruconis gallopava]